MGFSFRAFCSCNPWVVHEGGVSTLSLISYAVSHFHRPQEGDRFLMCSKKRPNNATSNYLISMRAGDLDRNSKNFLGKLRANFVGTEFQVGLSLRRLSGFRVPHDPAFAVVTCPTITESPEGVCLCFCLFVYFLSSHSLPGHF